MAIHQVTPPSEPMSPTDGSVRKRVCKACDRCRLKKSKCDGSSPCSRCKADNAICVFGERKKSHDKVYPKGYVEMLENQQSQLVTDLQELYKRTQNGQGWIGSPLKETSHGAPLTHDILERLGALKQDGHATGEAFEEDLNLMQQRLIASGAGFMPRDLSSDSDSEAVESPMFDQMPQMPQKPTLFTDPFSLNSFPPTPPNQSPYPQTARTVPSKMQSYSQPHRDQIGMNLNLHQRQSWGPSSGGFDDSMDLDFMAGFDGTSFGNAAPLFGQLQAPVGTMNPCLSMRYPEDDYINPGLL